MLIKKNVNISSGPKLVIYERFASFKIVQTNNSETNFYSKTFLFSPGGKFETRLIKLPLPLWHLGPQVDTKLQSAGKKNTSHIIQENYDKKQAQAMQCEK